MSLRAELIAINKRSSTAAAGFQRLFAHPTIQSRHDFQEGQASEFRALSQIHLAHVGFQIRVDATNIFNHPEPLGSAAGMFGPAESANLSMNSATPVGQQWEKTGNRTFQMNMRAELSEETHMGMKLIDVPQQVIYLFSFNGVHV